MSLPDSQYISTTGELYVAYKLASIGLIPALISQSTRAIDLIASSSDGSRTVGVYIKSAYDAGRGIHRSHSADATLLEFPLSQREIEQASAGAIFCFVDLQRRAAAKAPDVYVVPANVLVKQFSGVPVRKYSPFRLQRSVADMRPFLNNWQPFISALSDPSSASRALLSAPQGAWSSPETARGGLEYAVSVKCE
jgi:hypothetical protein